MSDPTAAIVWFACTLRRSGVEAGTDRVQALVTALDHLDLARGSDVYWAGRLTLCASPEDIAHYDRAFAAFFGGQRSTASLRRTAIEVRRPVAVPAPGPAGGPDPAGDDAESGARAATASRSELLRRRDLARLDPAERATVRRLIAVLDPVGETRRSRRGEPAHRGRLDARRTVRAMLSRGGEPVRLHRTRPRQRPRRLVLIVDVSGSMQPYADALLRFAHAAARRRPETEVFTLGTRLTRVTREIARADPDQALAAVAAAVPDWSGGTRIGDLLRDFLDGWGQRGAARGAVVVVGSDGWECGDTTALAQSMVRLHRLAHRVVWVNPHKARPGYAPLTAGMAAALPHVDDFVEGHSLGALEELARVVSGGARA